MRLGHAARFRGNQVLADHLRVHRAGEATCIVLCESYEFAFSTGWGTRGSRLCNDLFAEGWAAGDTSLDRLDRGVAWLVEGFRAQAPILWPDDPADPFEGGASATFLAVLDYNDALHVRWLGDATVRVIRAGTLIAATAGHTMRNRFRALGHSEAELAAFPNVLVANLMTTDPDAAVLPWLPGDHAVIISGEIVDYAAIPAALDDDLTASAERLVALASGDPFGVAALVVIV